MKLTQKSKRLLIEKFMIIFAMAEPLATIPQIIQVWSGSEHQAGVSLTTWVIYTLTSCIWWIYGIAKKDKPILASGAFWTVSEALVVLGLLVR